MKKKFKYWNEVTEILKTNLVKYESKPDKYFRQVLLNVQCLVRFARTLPRTEQNILNDFCRSFLANGCTQWKKSDLKVMKKLIKQDGRL
jgi:hypothetical protein